MSSAVADLDAARARSQFKSAGGQLNCSPRRRLPTRTKASHVHHR